VTLRKEKEFVQKKLSDEKKSRIQMEDLTEENNQKMHMMKKELNELRP
jgi:hypothetical protein